jgi:replicative DNA helicase
VKNAPQLPTHLPPQALEFEKAVLGAAMLEAPATSHVLEHLTERAFYQREHQLIFAAIRDVANDSQAVDMLTVIHQLKVAGLLERAGGMAYVAGLTARVDSAGNLAKHCAIVHQQYLRRVVQQQCTELLAKTYDEMLDPLDLVADATQVLGNVLTGFEQHQGGTVADYFEATFEKLRADVQREGLTGIPTGLTKLNDATGGWQGGNLIVLGARPGMGKTAAMLHFARAACLEEQNHAVIFSLEMSVMELMHRLITGESEGYSYSQLRRGDVAGGVPEVEALREKSLRLKADGHRIHIEDGSALSIQQLRAKCLRLHQQHPLGIIMVDYIQLMEAAKNAKGAGNREQEIAAISRGLKKLAKELNVPVIALAQLSREVEKAKEKRPELNHLRESGAIEQDADVIIMLWRAEYYGITEYEDGAPTQDTMLLDIKKNRHGSPGEVYVGSHIKRNVLFDLEDASTFEELPAAADFQPRRITVSTAGDFEQPASLHSLPRDPNAPF